MAERLSAPDTMFLDLEEADDGATMHFGAILVFGGLSGGSVPDIDAVAGTWTGGCMRCPTTVAVA